MRRPTGLRGRSCATLGAMALALSLAWAATGSGALAAGTGSAAAPPEIPANAQFVQLEPLQVPMTGPDRPGQAQALIVMQLAVNARADTARIRSLMPRLRDALIRDFYAYPLSQTGEFPTTVLPSVTRRVMAAAEATYGENVVVGVLFGQVMKIGC